MSLAKLTLLLLILIAPLIVHAQGPDSFSKNLDGSEEIVYATLNYNNIKDWSKIDWTQVDYTNPTLIISKVPPQYAADIDIYKALRAGKGHQLTLHQVTENTKPGQEGIPDIKLLNTATLATFFKRNYDATIDIQQCEAESCALVGGILYNGVPAKQSLPLNEIKNLNAQITMQNNGDINVVITKPAKISFTPQSSYFLSLNDNKKTPHEATFEGTTYKIHEGTLLIKEGRLFFTEGETRLREGTITVHPPPTERHDQSLVELVSGSVDPNKLQNQIRISENNIELSGTGFEFSYTGKGIKENNPRKKIRNGHQLIFQAYAHPDVEIPSRISFNTQTREAVITGAAVITNGNERITADGSNFISELRSDAGIIHHQNQQLNLYDMSITFANDPEKKLVIKNNNLQIGKNTVYYSAQLNEYGRAEINEYLGPRVRGDVIKPVILLLTPQLGARSLDHAEEHGTWETMRSSWLINRKKNQPIILFDLDQNSYSPSTPEKIENQQFVESLLVFAQEQDYPIRVLGHNAQSGDQFHLVINHETRSRDSSIYLPKNLFYGESFGGFPGLKNPVVAGCACAPYIGKKELSTTEFETVNMYLIGKTNAKNPRSYDWIDFVDDIKNKKILFTDENSCLATVVNIPKFYTELDTSQLPQLKKSCA